MLMYVCAHVTCVFWNQTPDRLLACELSPGLCDNCSFPSSTPAQLLSLFRPLSPIDRLCRVPYTAAVQARPREQGSCVAVKWKFPPKRPALISIVSQTNVPREQVKRGSHWAGPEATSTSLRAKLTPSTSRTSGRHAEKPPEADSWEPTPPPRCAWLVQFDGKGPIAGQRSAPSLSRLSQRSKSCRGGSGFSRETEHGGDRPAELRRAHRTSTLRGVSEFLGVSCRNMAATGSSVEAILL